MDIDNILENFNGFYDDFTELQLDLEKPFSDEISFDQNNNKYRGNIINGLFDGRGILYDKYDNSIIYNGYFKKGKQDNFGKLYRNGELIYEGFFSEGKYNGKGILYKNNIKIYEGYFKEGEYDGIGIEYFSNGNKKRKAIYYKNKICDECNGILYDNNNNEVYSGLLKYGRPKEGKNLIIYGDDDYIIYKGDFSSFKYNGKGIVYYENINKKKFDGILKDDYYAKGILYYKNEFKEYEGEFNNNKYEGEGILYFETNDIIYYKGSFMSGEFKNGTLYDLKGLKLYKGDFKNNMPKEGKNIKLYNRNGYLEFEGEIFDFAYNGKGKTFEKNIMIFEGIFENGNKVKGTSYENNIKKYEGEYKNDKFNGHGKLYEIYEDTNEIYLYYEGNFKDNQIFGEGIKYYKNKSKKIEGNFLNINSYKGKYYDPDNHLIFEGGVSHEIPFKSPQLKIYNDNGNLIYDQKIYKSEIIQKEKGYKPITDKKEFYKSTSSILISCGVTGKTNILNILIGNKYNENFIGTIGIDREILAYEYQKHLFKLTIFENPGQERFRNIPKKYYRNVDIIIIVFDLSEEDNFNKNLTLFDDIKKNSETKKHLIYLLGNKLDKASKELLEIYRQKSKVLIDTGKIDKYFEISAKTGEGINDFSKILKIDSAIFCSLKHEDKNLFSKNLENEDIWDCSLSVLNKFINY